MEMEVLLLYDHIEGASGVLFRLEGLGKRRRFGSFSDVCEDLLPGDVRPFRCGSCGADVATLQMDWIFRA